jgi:hypothetical protein
MNNGMGMKKKCSGSRVIKYVGVETRCVWSGEEGEVKRQKGSKQRQSQENCANRKKALLSKVS